MKWINYKKRIFRKIGKSLGKIGIFAGIICFAFCGISILGGTNSYFNDTATIDDSTFQAGILDLTVRSGQSNFVSDAENMISGKQVARDIYIGKTALSLPLQHNVDFEFVSGDADLCDQLDLKIYYNHYNGPVSGGYANRDMRLTYDGKLSALSDYGNDDFEIPHSDDQFDTDSSNGIEQWFYYSVALPSDTADFFQGKVCNFKFVFNAWQNNLTYLSGGFTDKEELGSIIKTKYWNSPVVLNEILPNPVGDDDQIGISGEWVELYNKTSNPLDLTGWYIKNSADNKIIIQTTNTLESSMTIDANGWLVLFMNDDILNDTGDAVSLYNSNDILVDSYTYALPEYNINNTPGQTNNLIGYWPLDDDVEDISGNTNNGTNNEAIFVSSPINGGLSFDGINDRVTIADASSLIPSNITLEAWVKNSGTPGAYKHIVAKHYAGGYASYALYTGSGGGLRFYIGHNSGFVASPAVTVSEIWDGNWHHIVGTYDGAKVRLYVDGAQVGTETATTVNIAYNTDNLYIGSYGNGYYYKGLMDEVKIYGRALDYSEVISHYGQIPENKSYARIPDGSSNWVDPVPTPGKPNILEEQIEIINQENFEEEFENIDGVNVEEFIIETIKEIVNQSIQEEEIITESVETEVVEPIISEEVNIITDETVEESTTEEQPTAEVIPVVEEQTTIEEISTIEEAPIQEPIIEPEPVIESKPVVEELVVEEPVIEESIVEEPILNE
jgi:hypothetical protein